MNGWLLDTNVISDPRRPKPNAIVRSLFHTKPSTHMFVSEVTFAEIRFGIEIADDPAKRSDLTNWLNKKLRPMFSGRVLPFHEDAMLRWRLMMEAGRKARHTFSQPDLMIAATAATENLIVVSRDTTDFAFSGVPVFDPWKCVVHTNGRALSVPNSESAEVLDIVTGWINS